MKKRKNTPCLKCDNCHKIASRYSGQCARGTAGKPASPAACCRRTTPRAAPRSQRSTRPGGAAAPAHTSWSADRFAPRAPDDGPDNAALATHGRQAVDPACRRRNHGARSSAKLAEEAARRRCRTRTRGLVHASARAARARRVP